MSPSPGSTEAEMMCKRLRRLGEIAPERGFRARDVGVLCYARGMSIAIQVHASDPAALAELIARAMHDGVIIDREPTIGTFSALVAVEEKEGERRRAAWKWLNSIS